MKGQQSIEQTQLIQLSSDDGRCYSLSSLCPKDSSSIFDYDIFTMRPTCSNASSSVIQSAADDEEAADTDEIYNQLYSEYDIYRIFLYHNNRRKMMMNRHMGGLNSEFQRKQGGDLTSGLFQVPSAVPDQPPRC